jgi:hypothetical protein
LEPFELGGPGRRTAAAGGRPQAGLEDVEKLLTSVDAANKTVWARSSRNGIVAP